MKNKVKILKQNGYNFLWIEDYLWMWDIPVEQEAQKRLASQAFGNVLVAGYGLGIAQKFLIRNPKVNSLLTIEINPDVIKECKRVFGEIYGEVEIADFLKYKGGKFNCVIGDIWEDIVPESLEKYKEFKDKCKNLIKPDGKIIAWGQEFFEYLLKEENENKIQE